MSDSANQPICLLINNGYFDMKEHQNEYKKEAESSIDAKEVEDDFKALGFRVVRKDCITREEALKTMNEYASVEHVSCFACVVLSYGSQGQVMCTDSPVTIDCLIAPFKGDRCKSLRGKPKLFFIQGCKGIVYEKDENKLEVDFGSLETDSRAKTPEKIPIESDFYIAYSTVPGFFKIGQKPSSWFIHFLLRVIKEHGKVDKENLELHHIMVVVNRLVAQEYEKCSDAQYVQKLMPSVVSMLTQPFYFKN